MSCPSNEVWRKLLDGGLSDAQAAPLERHLAQCSTCRDLLEQLTSSRDLPELSGLFAIPLDADGFLPPPSLRAASSRDTQSQAAAAAADNGAGADSSALRSAIPGYEIVRELGRGGMGVVYEARQLSLNRPVALKVILSAMHAAPQVRQRFLAEAATIARLRHPGIVQVYELGLAGDSPFFSLELVVGVTLSEHLRQAGGVLPSHQAAELVAQVAAAMAHAHGAGVLHRDLKPSNILLDGEGRAKVTDFGLAKLEGQAFTATGQVLGTPAYMSPEQASGRIREMTPASDVYSLGAVLYELLTGQPPFRAETAVETIMQVLLHEPPPPSRAAAQLPADLVAIVMTCLRKQPVERYPDAAALGADLARFLAGEPVQALSARPTARRKPVLVRRLAAVAGGLLLLVAAGFAWRMMDGGAGAGQLEPPALPPPVREDDELVQELPLANPSFEPVALPPGGRLPLQGLAHGWRFETRVGGAAVLFRPASNAYDWDDERQAADGADGKCVLTLLRSAPGASPVASQEAAYRVAAGTDYELLAAVGVRRTAPGPAAGPAYGGYRLELWAGSVMLGHVTDEEDAAAGEFADVSLTALARQIPADAVGQLLRVRLMLSKPGAPVATDFDHIRLRARRPAATAPVDE